MKIYRCDCGWEGSEEDMEADNSGDMFDEVWSNWICPGCGYWHQSIEDYEIIEDSK